MTTAFWITLFASTVGFVSGTVALTKYAASGSLLWLALSFTIFAIANLLYARILAHGLSQGAALSSISHLLLLVLVGTVMGERLTGDRVAAVVLAAVAIWLFSKPTGAS
ncbi:MAG: hypothetical protein AAGE90_16235 [Pseudomonadota bacterium]